MSGRRRSRAVRVGVSGRMSDALGRFADSSGKRRRRRRDAMAEMPKASCPTSEWLGDPCEYTRQVIRRGEARHG
jgi:hypothetical protein